MIKLLKKYCPCCESSSLKFAFELEQSPLADIFQKNNLINDLDKKLELKLIFCEKCTHLFLNRFFSPKKSYKDYIYNTKLTVGLTKHYDEYAADLKKIVKSRLCALDIGSNDGSSVEYP